MPGKIEPRIVHYAGPVDTSSFQIDCNHASFIYENLDLNTLSAPHHTLWLSGWLSGKLEADSKCHALELEIEALKIDLSFERFNADRLRQMFTDTPKRWK